ncbi:MAG: THUMP domain-containing protein, partial [Promethearchaeota archaeon]
ELWFILFMCGDKYPIISKSTFSGLITALTNLDAKNVIFKIQRLLKKDSNFFQFILKIIPIDFVCETNMKILVNLVRENSKMFIKEGDSFKIVLKRRKHEKLERDMVIERIADQIDNKVDLEDPDKLIRIEVLGNFCGVSFLEKKHIIRSGSSSFI